MSAGSFGKSACRVWSARPSLSLALRAREAGHASHARRASRPKARTRHSTAWDHGPRDGSRDGGPGGGGASLRWPQAHPRAFSAAPGPTSGGAVRAVAALIRVLRVLSVLLDACSNSTHAQTKAAVSACISMLHPVSLSAPISLSRHPPLSLSQVESQHSCLLSHSISFPLSPINPIFPPASTLPPMLVSH